MTDYKKVVEELLAECEQDIKDHVSGAGMSMAEWVQGGINANYNLARLQTLIAKHTRNTQPRKQS